MEIRLIIIQCIFWLFVLQVTILECQVINEVIETQQPNSSKIKMKMMKCRENFFIIGMNKTRPRTRKLRKYEKVRDSMQKAEKVWESVLKANKLRKYEKVY